MLHHALGQKKTVLNFLCGLVRNTLLSTDVFSLLEFVAFHKILPGV